MVRKKTVTEQPTLIFKHTSSVLPRFKVTAALTNRCANKQLCLCGSCLIKVCGCSLQTEMHQTHFLFSLLYVLDKGLCLEHAESRKWGHPLAH